MKIVTLTLSPAYDLHICCDSFAAGKENLATLTSRDIGGKGINISRALSAFGAESTALVCLGRENCEEFEARLNEEKFQPGWDIVVVARTRAIHAPFNVLTENYLALAKKAGILNETL